MSLISSISGIRGTIGGDVTSGLNPINIAEFTAAYATFIKKNSPIRAGKVVVARDGRISGEIVKGIVIPTLQAMGLEVVDLDYATTPTTEIAVVHELADGGIIITASHNPRHWNALKLLNHRGEFLNATEGEEVLQIAQERAFVFASVNDLGKVTQRNYTERHIQDILNLPYVDAEAIRACGFRVAVDCINSVGSLIVPKLLTELGVAEVIVLNGEVTGDFAHNPEPLAIHLQDLSNIVTEKKAHVGFAVDPDVDRLAIMCEDGTMFGEENTLISIADYLLEQNPGAKTVSNLSSSRGLRDITYARGGEYHTAAVGEVNVVHKMKEVSALIGGEGNGGVILPALHYGRDALVGIALYLTMMAKRTLTPAQLLQMLPKYAMAKEKVELPEVLNFDTLVSALKAKYSNAEATTIDGLKLDFPTAWVHLRKSNTEPILRIYAEAPSEEEAHALAQEVIGTVQHVINQK